MTTMTNPNTKMLDNTLIKFIAFVFSAMVGIVGGGVLLLAGWVLVRTGLAGVVAQQLGITAQTPWHFSRAAGMVAYLLLAGSTIWGLLLSSKIIKEAVPAALALATHNIFSWLAAAFTGLHAVALLFDNYFTYTLADITIPFIGPYQPGWVGLGILSLYIMLLVSLSFQFRKQLGQKWWRALHYLSFAVYVLVTAHGLMAGSDSGKPGVQAMYIGSGLLVFFLINFRLLTSKGQRPRRRRTSS